MSPEDPTAAITRAADALGDLPVLSGTVGRVVALADDPESSTGEMVATLESDESFAVNLLRFANSAHNARPIRASSVRQAVTLLGRVAVKRLALEAATYRFLEQVPGNGSASRGQMHVHAVTVASAAAAFAECVGAEVDTAHLAGLLHDVGKLLMPTAFGEDAAEDVARRSPGGAARVKLEREVFGIDHAAAGGLLIARWGLPDAVAEAVRLHHGDPRGAAPATREVAAVQLADAVIRMLEGSAPDAPLIAAALEFLGLGLDDLDDLVERALSCRTAVASGVAAELIRLEEAGRLDDLTGVRNRKAWLRELRTSLAVGPGSVVLCGIDNLTVVNETHGYAMGDMLLVEVARVLDRHGVAGRLGGVHFALWVSGAPEAGTTAADAVRRSLSESLRQAGGLEGVGVRVGVAHWNGPADPRDLLERAERAAVRDADRTAGSPTAAPVR
ncbi:MAG: HDOD domain-containing protein [Thermoleophilia bacterium]